MSFTISITNQISTFTPSQVYWAIICQNSSGQQCYVASDGSLIPAAVTDNTHVFDGGTANNCNGGNTFANYCQPLSSLPSITIQDSDVLISGQIWVGLGNWVPFCIKPGPNPPTTIAIAPPSISNPSLQGYNLPFQFAEFTYQNQQLNINSTSVDAVGFPMDITVTSGTSTVTTTTTKSFSTIISEFQNCVDNNFNSLLIPNNSNGTLRIISPEHAAAGPGGTPPAQSGLGIPKAVIDYFDSFYTKYISECWDLYSNNNSITIYIAGQAYTGSVTSGIFSFNDSNNNNVLNLTMPDNGSVLQCAGVLASGNAVQKNIQKFIAAALYRGVFHLPPGGTATVDSWSDATTQRQYYAGATGTGQAAKITAPINYYAKILHEASSIVPIQNCGGGASNAVNGCCYAFAYDDVCQQSSSLCATSLTSVQITLPAW